MGSSKAVPPAERIPKNVEGPKSAPPTLRLSRSQDNSCRKFEGSPSRKPNNICVRQETDVPATSQNILLSGNLQNADTAGLNVPPQVCSHGLEDTVVAPVPMTRACGSVCLDKHT